MTASKQQMVGLFTLQGFPPKRGKENHRLNSALLKKEMLYSSLEGY